MISNVLSSAFKRVILDNKLYDTGALHDSIQVDINIVGSKIIIQVHALDYIKYHLESYDLTKQFTGTSEFTSVVQSVIANYLKSALVGKNTSNEDISIDFSYILQDI